MKLKRGFTLIELLVVIAIIAILASILFPVFAQAKEAAKKANCLSNIKNISLAWLLYLADYDDVIPSFAAASSGGVPGNGVGHISYYWFGSETNASNFGLTTTSDWTQGYLAYLKSGPIQECPSAKDLLASAADVGPSSYPAYGINAGVGTGATSFSTVDMAAETIIFADAAGIDQAAPYDHAVRWYTYQPNYSGQGLLHARHNEAANIGWMDGHVKSSKITYRSFQVVNLTPAVAKASRLGDLFKWTQQCTVSTSACTATQRLQDFYYALLTKPAAP